MAGAQLTAHAVEEHKYQDLFSSSSSSSSSCFFFLVSGIRMVESTSPHRDFMCYFLRDPGVINMTRGAMVARTLLL
jgi:hypothetical protein